MNSLSYGGLSCYATFKLTLCFLVELPNVWMLDREHDEATGVLLKQRFVLLQLSYPSCLFFLLVDSLHKDRLLWW